MKGLGLFGLLLAGFIYGVVVDLVIIGMMDVICKPHPSVCAFTKQSGYASFFAFILFSMPFISSIMFSWLVSSQPKLQRVGTLFLVSVTLIIMLSMFFNNIVIVT